MNSESLEIGEKVRTERDVFIRRTLSKLGGPEGTPVSHGGLLKPTETPPYIGSPRGLTWNQGNCYLIFDT